MELYWGFTNNDYDTDDSRHVSKKRKLEQIEDSKNDKVNPLFKFEDKMIYSIDNEVHFTADINKDTIEKLIRKITKIINNNKDKYNSKSKEKLKISYIVDSPGGSVTSVLKFVDFIRLVKKKYPFIEFTSVATGMVASAGTVMCIIADKRLMTQNAFAMIHELSSGNSGKYSHFMSYANFLSVMHETLTNIYLSKTNKTKEELEQLLNAETWFSAKEYMKHGFVEELVAIV
jgi:ATP-dependent protease ClpP protease subunit